MPFITERRRFLSLATLVLAGLPALALAQAEAQAPAPQPSGFDSTGWGVQCENAGDDLQCVASIRVMTNPGNQMFFSIALQEGAEDANPTLVMQLPFGLNLPAGVTLSVDGGAPSNHVIDTCLQTGCFSVEEAEQELIDQFIAGAAVAVTLQSSSGEPISMELPLTGFQAAFSRLN